jgi:hypothetical protein
LKYFNVRFFWQELEEHDTDDDDSEMKSDTPEPKAKRARGRAHGLSRRAKGRVCGHGRGPRGRGRGCGRLVAEDNSEQRLVAHEQQLQVNIKFSAIQIYFHIAFNYILICSVSPIKTLQIRRYHYRLYTLYGLSIVVHYKQCTCNFCKFVISIDIFYTCGYKRSFINMNF